MTGLNMGDLELTQRPINRGAGNKTSETTVWIEEKFIPAWNRKFPKGWIRNRDPWHLMFDGESLSDEEAKAEIAKILGRLQTTRKHVPGLVTSTRGANLYIGYIQPGRASDDDNQEIAPDDDDEEVASVDDEDEAIDDDVIDEDDYEVEEVEEEVVEEAPKPRPSKRPAPAARKRPAPRSRTR
jgi:hypothetical protein